MQIEPFGVEQWMNKWETRCTHNLAETCVHSLTLGELLQIAEIDPEALGPDLAGTWMGYGAIPGSERLRALAAAHHDAPASHGALICHGTIGANHLVWQTLCGPGDRVASLVPTYQQHTSIPRALGAEVIDVPLLESGGWVPDWQVLETAAASGLRLISAVNPNNPTGAILDAAALTRLATIAERSGAWLLVDEVYRGTEAGAPVPSVASLTPRGIATGGMSKALSLAGLRVGWLVAPHDVLTEVEQHRDYTTISVGVLDDHLATLALENASTILARSRKLLDRNRALLAAWVEAEPKVSWVLPEGGTTALLRIDDQAPSYELCEALLADTGVMFTPGSVMGVEGTVRIGYGNPTDAMKQGLAAVSAWLAQR